MQTVELHKSQFGGWWVDVLELHEGKQRIVKTVSFTDYQKATEFWAKMMKKLAREVT